MKHIAINYAGGSEEAFKAGILRTLQEAEHTAAGEILLLVPTTRNLTEGDIERVLGRALVAKLRKGHRVRFGPSNLHMRAATVRTVETSPTSELIIGAYLSPTEFEKVLSNAHNAVASIYIPWMDNHLEHWKLKNPELIDVRTYLSGHDDG